MLNLLPVALFIASKIMAPDYNAFIRGKDIKSDRFQHFGVMNSQFINETRRGVNSGRFYLNLSGYPRFKARHQKAQLLLLALTFEIIS